MVIGWRASTAISPIEQLLQRIVPFHASMGEGFAYRIEHCRLGLLERSVVGHGMPIIPYLRCKRGYDGHGWVE
jgi:hypothetical protein